MKKSKTKIFKGTTPSGHTKLLLTVPKAWVAQIGIKQDDRDVVLYFDGDIITVQRPELSGVKVVPLASKSRIFSFAVKWLELFKNHKNIPEYLYTDHRFLGRELSDLGFIMDCGGSINGKFPDTNTGSLEGLKSIIDKVEIKTLGNAIYSEWRYFSHWAIGGMQEENYQWFVVAFTRLVELTSPANMDEYYMK